MIKFNEEQIKSLYDIYDSNAKKAYDYLIQDRITYSKIETIIDMSKIDNIHILILGETMKYLHTFVIPKIIENIEYDSFNNTKRELLLKNGTKIYFDTIIYRDRQLPKRFGGKFDLEVELYCD
jgi:hypothetical protein